MTYISWFSGLYLEDYFMYKAVTLAGGIYVSPCSLALVFIAGRPKAALLLWFFGDFRCGALLFIWLFTLYINIKIGKNSC